MNVFLSHLYANYLVLILSLIGCKWYLFARTTLIFLRKSEKNFMRKHNSEWILNTMSSESANDSTHKKPTKSRFRFTFYSLGIGVLILIVLLMVLT